MFKLKNCVSAITLAVTVAATGTFVGSAVGQKSSEPKPQERLAVGENDVKEILDMIDRYNKGKITRQEFMSFMEARFGRSDKHKSGVLDVNEPTLYRTHYRAFARTHYGTFASMGK